MGSWNFDYWNPAYGMAPQWDAAGGAVVVRRERPKLLFGPGGNPSWLYNGITIAKGGLDPGQKNSFTFAQQVTGVNN